MKNAILEKNTCKLFHVLAQFLFTTGETKLDYDHQKMNLRIASRVAKQLKTYDLRKLENFTKIPDMLGFGGEYPAGHSKPTFSRFSVKNYKKSAGWRKGPPS